MTYKNEFMSNADTSFMRMETPDSLMVIPILFVFEEPVPYDRMKRLLEQRLLKFKRFSQRIVSSPKKSDNPEWEYCRSFNIDEHLFEITLPQPEGESELREFINGRVGLPLDFKKPLWEACLIKKYNSGSALLFRVHHCLADGFSLLVVGSSLGDLTREGNPGFVSAAVTDCSENQHVEENTKAAFVLLLESAVEGSKKILNYLKHPSAFFRMTREYLKFIISFILIVTRRPDPETFLKGPLGRDKCVAWSKPISLNIVKQLSKTANCTINDLLLALTSGTILRCLERHHESADNINLRLAVTVNLRTGVEGGNLGNQSGMVFPALPVGIKDFNERVAIIKKRMNRLKDSGEAGAVFNLAASAAYSPRDLQYSIMGYLGRKYSGVFTNMILPPVKLYGAGSPVSHVISWVVPLGVSIGFDFLSYGGEVVLGVITDKGIIPEPEKIIEDFHSEFDEAAALYQV